ncbi:MAG: aldo/keto reductase [Spirochaetes bacterium]|nr:aldo/keto reductase [Spirochaetota bacterium]
MKRIKLSKTLTLPEIVHGMWRLIDWKWSFNETLEFIESAVNIGITAFDHADIYGNYECEKEFGKAMSMKPELRNKIQLITKCGIKLVSDKYPECRTGHYDTSKKHIISSVEKSLINLKTDYIDLLLIHRPDHLMNPDEIADAFSHLLKQGKVLNFGVSNFLPSQLQLIQSRFSEKLVANQLEISPAHLEHLNNGNLNFLLKENIIPMAWSPLGGGSIFTPRTENAGNLKRKLEEIALQLNAENIDTVIYSWLFAHPSGIIPVVGSGKIERLKTAVEATDVKLNRQQWYEILIASQGHPVP